MTKLVTVVLGLLVSSQAWADGWVCNADDLKVRVYNNVQPSEGTRNVAVMVLSDPKVAFGRKTIAKFTASNSTLENESSLYTARVDLRFNDSGRKGELIAGTKLGFLKTILLDVDFSYAAPIADGDVVDATMTLVKRDGASIEKDLSCERYLKN